MYNRYENFPKRHIEITPDNDNDLKMYYIIIAGSDGDIVARDEVGTEITYTLTAGAVLPIMPVRIKETSTVDPIIGVW